jgi:hypothetical protein
LEYAIAELPRTYVVPQNLSCKTWRLREAVSGISRVKLIAAGKILAFNYD